jgi:hypothetical protein
MQLSSLSLALTAIYGPGFAWRNLFADGTPGFRINVEEAIRLNQQALGPELANPDAWGSGNAWATISDGVFTFTGGAASSLALSAATEVGKTYVLDAPSSFSGASLYIQFGTPAVRKSSLSSLKGLIFTADAAGGIRIGQFSAGVLSGSFGPISVREIDLSKCVAFQDSAGTLPVTAMEQPLGLILDTKLGVPVRGPELVPALTFDSNIAGVPYVARGTKEWNAGALRLVTTEVNLTYGVVAATSALPITPGVWQEIVVVLRTRAVADPGHVMGVYFSSRQNSALSPLGMQMSSPGTYRFFKPGGSSLPYLTLRSEGGTPTIGDVFEIESISVREVPGNHFIQPSNTPSRSIVSRRVNLLTATETLATQSVTTLAASHVLTFSGTGSVTLSGTATGTYSAGTHTITTTAGTLTVTVSGSVTNADLRLSIDANLPQYQRVTSPTDYDESGFPAYAKFDGVDDWLETAGNLDLTSTDEVTVLAGVTKLSDAGSQYIYETTTNSGTNDGAFSLLVPGGQNYRVRSRGTVEAVQTSSPVFPAPRKDLLTQVSKIGDDLLMLRVNGAQAISVSTDQGTGNYGAHEFYMGRRGGTSLPFNGRVYGITVVGKLLDDSTLARAEQAERNLGRLY